MSFADDEEEFARNNWGVINDSGQWEVFRVGEKAARQAYNDIHYGKLVRDIYSDDRYEVVEQNLNPHT